ncbi:MAG TPA: choice-of-anchor tandem repeat GloVer-containing protein [Bacteroidia bacterium]|jgi:uncharacterized repeat protein (TIGR03803 family)
MKTKNYTLLLFIAFIGFMIPGILKAQYTKLCEYSGSTTGSTPYGTLVSDGTFLYGMTDQGGINGKGTIFKIMPDGTGYSTLFAFDGPNGRGALGSLISEGSFLYGMTWAGGTNDKGVVFKIESNGTNYVKLHEFNGLNGESPYGSLVSDGVFLYGMTPYGGSNGAGVIFKIKNDGTAYTKLIDCNNMTGGNPRGTLIFDGIFLYGMTLSSGTIFKIKPDGTGYLNIYSFTSIIDWAGAYGTLVSDGTYLYGMAQGGINGAGVIFKIMPDGTGFSKIYDFTGSLYNYLKTLIYDGTYLYGMSKESGFSSKGYVFKIKTDGTDFTTIHNFNGTDGANPDGSLVSDGTFLYGMTNEGGTSNAGTIFKIKPDSTNFTKLFDFDHYSIQSNGAYPRGTLVSDSTFMYGVAWGGTNGKGVILKIKPNGSECSVLFDFNSSTVSGPIAGVLSDDSCFYGTAGGGGTANGTIYKIKRDGTGFTHLHSFGSGPYGRFPSGSLISDGTFLYGVTNMGGINGNDCAFGCGVIYRIKKDGTAYSVLHTFNATEGRHPQCALIFDGTFLYGMTGGGGLNGLGTIFKLKPDGTDFTTLLNFAGSSNGSIPLYSGLVSDGNFLYGMTGRGGAYDHGTVFKIMTDGTGYSKLFDFDSINGSGPSNTLILDGSFLYGMTPHGGVSADCYGGCGTAFRIKTDGTWFTKILDFDNFSNGSEPTGAFFSDGVSLYGTTEKGGTYDYGTVFKLGIPVVGIAENNSVTEFKTYPNPATGPIIVETNEKEFCLNITNILGGKIYQAKIKNPKAEIDLSKQPNGVYFINVQSEKGSGTQKVIIQH